MNSDHNSVIILAAGNGSRLKSDTPKIFHTIGGLKLIDHVIRCAEKINPQNIFLVLNPKFKNFELEYEKDIKKVYQEIANGTGGAVKCVLDSEQLSDDGYTYILYGDIPLISPENLKNLKETAEKCEKTAVVVLAMPSDPSQNLGRLLSTGKDDQISQIVEASDSKNYDDTLFLANTGLLVRNDILKKFINQIKPNPKTNEFYITEIVRIAYEAGFVCRYCEGSVEELSGINTREDLAKLEKFFQNSMRKKHMNNGVTLVAPETTFFSFDTEIENDVTIHPYVIFKKNVHIKKGAEIGPFCVVEGATVKNSQIGPFARIRPTTEINDGVRIGNFVEIKNSKISEGAKINHLSYIGDSSVGEKSNIGAGTITCNYDGFKKYKTYIGKNVFVGSNTAIVAPNKIEDNAIIGAGSVITKQVNENELAVTRSNQKNIEYGAKIFREKRTKE